MYCCYRVVFQALQSFERCEEHADLKIGDVTRQFQLLFTKQVRHKNAAGGTFTAKRIRTSLWEVDEARRPLKALGLLVVSDHHFQQFAGELTLDHGAHASSLSAVGGHQV